MADNVPTSSGGNLSQVEISSTPTPTTTSVTTVTLRSEDVLAIVSGLAANPSTLAAVALMMQSDGQQDSPVKPTATLLYTKRHLFIMQLRQISLQCQLLLL